jgi:CPA1 family monovalent cation:H+ antiporter
MPHFPPVIFGIASRRSSSRCRRSLGGLPIPTPILQLVAGLALGLAPGVSTPELDPDLVFFVFLPPILWSAAMFTSPREFPAKHRLDQFARGGTCSRHHLQSWRSLRTR